MTLDQPLPLQPTRAIRFETDEGTWVSVDVAPDGRTIIFELLGDLYTVPISGGHAMRITSGIAFDSQPRYSPDGSKIVFVSDHDGADNLWIADADGTHAHAITRERNDLFVSPVWTPDGRSIVTSRAIDAGRSEAWGVNGEIPLYVYALAGGTGLKVSGALFPPITGVSRSGAGRYLGAAFGADGELFSAVDRSGMENGDWQIISFDRTTAQPRFRTDAVGSALRPVVSRDGHYLVYATRTDTGTSLELQDLETGDRRTLVPEATRDAQREGAYEPSRDLMPGSAFTPDGRAFITSYQGKLWRIEVPSGQVSPIPFTATVEQVLGPFVRAERPRLEEPPPARQIAEATPSPDGMQLVFRSLGHLWVANIADGRARRLTQMQTQELSPVWSPDGRYVAYATWRDGEGGNIFRVNANTTGEPEKLTDEAAYYDGLAYMPDGEHLVALRAPVRVQRESWLRSKGDHRASLPDRTLISVPAAGGPISRITPLTGSTTSGAVLYGTPHFTGEAERVYLYNNQSGLVSMRRDGSDAHSILEVTGLGRLEDRVDQVSADEVTLSPDGKYALALVTGRLYLIAFPRWARASAPLVCVDDLSAAPLPTILVSAIGGDLPGWAADGQSFFYSLGHSFFRWRVDDVVRRARLSTHGPRSVAEPVRTDVIVDVPQPAPRATLALRGARVVTMKNNEVIENADVVVMDGRFASVGTRGSVEIPPDARSIDVKGKTIIPGFVDIRARFPPNGAAQDPQYWVLLVNFAYGVTTVRLPQAQKIDLTTSGDLSETGALPIARVLPMPRGGLVDAHSLEDTREAIRRFAQYDEVASIQQYFVGNRKQREWFVMAARELGLIPAMAAGGDLRLKLTLAADGYPEIGPAIRTFPLYRDVIEFMARSGVTYSLSVLQNQADYFYRRDPIEGEERLMRFTPPQEIESLPFHGRAATSGDAYSFESTAADAAKISSASGNISVGSNGVLQGLGFQWELWATQSGGMSAHAVLRAATISGATAIGWGHDIGSIEPGKLADLQILDGNPLEDIRQTRTLRYVMKSGHLYEAATLNEVWPRSVSLSPLWWQRDEK